MILPLKLKCLRKKAGLTQLDLSEKLNVSRQAVSSWESGTSKPSTDNLKCLGALYDVPLEYLLNNDAPEPVCATSEESKEVIGNNIKHKHRSVVLIPIVTVLAVALLCILLFGHKGNSSISMTDIEGSDIVTVDNMPVVQATGKFDIEVPGKSAVKAGSSFPLEVGEVVTIKATYSPFSANVDFGVFAPDGLFYGLNATNGVFDKSIKVTQRGNYYFAVRNNSSVTISASGYVNC